MNLWLIALALLIIGMMAWPILLLKPTEKQKQLAQKRLALSQQGIKVINQGPKLPDSLRYAYQDLAQAVQYIDKHNNPLLSSSHLAIRNPDSKQWFWLGERPPAALIPRMLSCYEALPDWCLAVQQDKSSNRIFALASTKNQTQLLSLFDTLKKI